MKEDCLQLCESLLDQFATTILEKSIENVNHRLEEANWRERGNRTVKAEDVRGAVALNFFEFHKHPINTPEQQQQLTSLHNCFLEEEDVESVEGCHSEAKKKEMNSIFLLE